MKIVATNQAATNVDATQILQDRAARLQGEGARPRKLQEADATADRALKALEALPGSRYDAAATAAAALAGADLGLTRNERLAVLNVAPTNAAVVGAVVDNDTREPRLDDAQVAKVCAVAKELRACARCVPGLLATLTCSPGDVMKATRVFTREDLDAWARLTGDANAIHVRPVPPFEAPIVPGLLLAATFPAVFARHHPGAVYRTQSLRFDKAVPVGAEVLSEIEVVGAVRETRAGAFATCARRCGSRRRTRRERLGAALAALRRRPRW